MSHTIKNNRRALDYYLKLVKKFPLTSIRNDEELTAAQAVLDGLLDNEPLDEGAEEYLEALSDLIALYEEEHVPMSNPSDAAMLRHLMEAKGVSQASLTSHTGIGKSTISEILSGKRPLTRKNVAKLSKYFHVGQGTFSLAIGDEREN